MYSIGCIVHNNGHCGEGHTSMKLECVKVNKQTLSRTSVELANCDQYEVRRANGTKRDVCHIPCYNYEWRQVNSSEAVRDKKLLLNLLFSGW
jgi:hypothetical protein